jgi:hypothetical protein
MQCQITRKACINKPQFGPKNTEVSIPALTTVLPQVTLRITKDSDMAVPTLLMSVEPSASDLSNTSIATMPSASTANIPNAQQITEPGSRDLKKNPYYIVATRGIGPALLVLI